MTGQRFQAWNGEHEKVRLPDGHNVYAIGDIHGRLDLLKRLLDTIEKDIAETSCAEHSVIFLGDYIDRGPHSKGVIEHLASLSIKGATCRYLMGNHESFMINLMVNGGDVDIWFHNGGWETLASYGIDISPRDSAFDGSRIGATLVEAVPEHHKQFLESLHYSWRIGDIFFAHAGVNPNRSIEDQQIKDLIWIREEFLQSERDHGPLIVHGHTPRPEPEVMRNRINVDTGAWHSDHLTAVVLKNGHCRFLST